MDGVVSGRMVRNGGEGVNSTHRWLGRDGTEELSRMALRVWLRAQGGGGPLTELGRQGTWILHTALPLGTCRYLGAAETSHVGPPRGVRGTDNAEKGLMTEGLLLGVLIE